MNPSGGLESKGTTEAILEPHFRVSGIIAAQGVGAGGLAQKAVKPFGAVCI